MLQTKKQMPDKNEPLRDLLQTVADTPPKWTKDAYGNHFAWLHLQRPSELKTVAEALAGKVRLCTITAYAEERDDTNKRRRIAYHFAGGNIIVTVTVPIYDPESLQKLPVPSITPWFRNADWNEREFREMFNIDIEGHPNPKRLFLDERLDAGIMTKLIPFSAMANSAGTNTLWERILEAKGVPPEERLPSLATPSEPIKLQPAFTPVVPEQPIEPSLATPTLVNMARSAEEATRALGRRPEKPTAPQEGTPKAAETAKSDTVQHEQEQSAAKPEVGTTQAQREGGAVNEPVQEKTNEAANVPVKPAEAKEHDSASQAASVVNNPGDPAGATAVSVEEAGAKDSLAEPDKPAEAQQMGEKNSDALKAAIAPTEKAAAQSVPPTSSATKSGVAKLKVKTKKKTR